LHGHLLRLELRCRLFLLGTPTSPDNISRELDVPHMSIPAETAM